MRFARVFAISVTILLLLSLSTMHSYASTYNYAHGCAQPVPPLMPGSPGPPPATPGIVLINEVLNNPGSPWNCAEPANTSSLTTDSWVEIYNPQNQPFNLYEARASLDSGSIADAFHFPFGAVIAAHGYLVVFPEAYSMSRSSIAGNTIRLMFANATVIDQVSVPALSADTSYARIPDGSANWTITTNPTIDASNLSSTQTIPTPVSTKKPSSHGGSSGGSSSGGNGYSASTPTVVSGSQPGWAKLQMPALASRTPVTTSPLLTSPTSPTTSAGDVPRRILLTALLVALALSLFWCWRLYKSP